MQVFKGRADGAKSGMRSDTFSGVVWADPIMPTTDNVTIGHVFFSPGARTYWHTHEIGQVLTVTSGKGWVCLDGQDPQVIRQGDVVWIGPHERHWHGAAADSFMSHIATSIGKTLWEEELSQSQYDAVP